MIVLRYVSAVPFEMNLIKPVTKDGQVEEDALNGHHIRQV
jgi:hypothetical protein